MQGWEIVDLTKSDQFFIRRESLKAVSLPVDFGETGLDFSRSSRMLSCGESETLHRQAVKNHKALVPSSISQANPFFFIRWELFRSCGSKKKIVQEFPPYFLFFAKRVPAILFCAPRVSKTVLVLNLKITRRFAQFFPFRSAIYTAHSLYFMWDPFQIS